MTSVAGLPGPATLYTVRSGDTLSSIAVAHGVTVDDLLAYNQQLPNRNLIIADSTLYIPAQSAVAPQALAAPLSARQVRVTLTAEHLQGLSSEELDAFDIYEAIADNPKLVQALKRKLGVGNPQGADAGVEYVGLLAVSNLVNAARRAGYPLTDAGVARLRSELPSSSASSPAALARALVDRVLGRDMPQPSAVNAAGAPIRVDALPQVRRSSPRPGQSEWTPAMQEVLDRRSKVDNTTYDSIILAAADHYNLPPALLKAVIAWESNFNPSRPSPAGAKGLAQLMDATARDMGVTNPNDATQSIMGGARYLRHLINTMGDDASSVLAAYNAGPTTVLRFGGVPPIARSYVQNVLRLYAYYLNTGQPQGE